jgi:signal transduction histidine kinase
MRRLLALALLAAGAALGVYAYRVQVDAHHQSNHALAIVAIGWSFLVAGLVAWSERPANRMGRLLVLTGFALLARQLRYSQDALVFTVFFMLGDTGYALVGHTTLAYPSGRVTDRFERALVIAGYTTALVFPPLAALFFVYTGPQDAMLQFDPLPRDSLISVTGNAHVVELLQKTQIVIFFGILATLFIVAICRRLWQATPRMRRILAPLALAAVAFALRAIFEVVFTFVDAPFAYDYLFWWQTAAVIALPIALVAGLLRARLARAGVGDLVLELEHAPPQELQDALARTLGDPTLEVAIWLPERQTYVDPAGGLVELPEDGARAVTRLDHDGGPLAAIVHDPSLLEEPELVRAAGAAARLALENAQLQAETRAQLTEVKESRVRIVAAADEERRRIERDIHDGAQQRLAALALQLRTAQRRLDSREADPEVDALLESAVIELLAANEELRELVRGVYPAILTEEGLPAALESLARRNPFPVELDVVEERFPAQVEATAYFVACEGLANVAKHAQASKASVSVTRSNGLLAVDVADDGVGGARPLDGSGLSGLADRVEALGGRLHVRSPAGEGTRLTAEIPCES